MSTAFCGASSGSTAASLFKRHASKPVTLELQPTFSAPEAARDANGFATLKPGEILTVYSEVVRTRASILASLALAAKHAVAGGTVYWLCLTSAGCFDVPDFLTQLETAYCRHQQVQHHVAVQRCGGTDGFKEMLMELCERVIVVPCNDLVEAVAFMQCACHDGRLPARKPSPPPQQHEQQQQSSIAAATATATTDLVMLVGLGAASSDRHEERCTGCFAAVPLFHMCELLLSSCPCTAMVLFWTLWQAEADRCERGLRDVVSVLKLPVTLGSDANAMMLSGGSAARSASQLGRGSMRSTVPASASSSSSTLNAASSFHPYTHFISGYSLSQQLFT